MKLLLLFFGVISTASAAAQLPGREPSRKFSQGQVLLYNKERPGDTLKFRLEDDSRLKPGQSPVGNQVVTLPVDRMPCLVPDTRSMVAIPNSWGQVTVPYQQKSNPIPNPSQPPARLRYSVTDPWKKGLTR